MKWHLALLFLLSCSNLSQRPKGDEVMLGHDEKKFHLHFSHNINGETHPCGCRHFPLGGIPQVAGIFETWKKEGNYIYVDTGDTFFSSTKIPPYVLNSQEFTAKQITQFLNELNLSYMVLGDQDFALGIPFLQSIQLQAKFKFLLTNAKESFPIIHSKYVRLKFPDNTQIFLLGITSPELLAAENAQFFDSPEESLTKTIKEIENAYNIKSNDRFILLSHSGIETDKKLANLFPQLSWIVGAHSQSFMRVPYVENQTSIVQVLSRNHYLGKIDLNLSDKGQDQYLLQEVSDEWQNKISPNPYTEKLQTYKNELMEIQDKEQNQQTMPQQTAKHSPTVRSCQTCHAPQNEFWKSTPHSLAYGTLIKEKAQHNDQCIGCHTLYYKDQRGFSAPKEMVTFSEKSPSHYWGYIEQFLSKSKSIRALAANDRKKMATLWEKHDQKNLVVHQNANVQCLNCHDQHPDHPFNSKTSPTTVNYQTCLKCHTNDQSPSWYSADGVALETQLDKMLKKVTCPKN